MLKSLVYTLFASVVLFGTVMSEIVRDNGTTNEFMATSRVLSRRKRFLTFPVGSSLQLVFCVQTAALIPIGDIFLYGNTAALAWTLPSDTTFLDDLKQKEQAQRRGDTTKITYLDENGRVIAKVPYKRRPIVNPAFAKRSTDENQLSFKEKLKQKIDRMKMHEKQSRREYMRKEVDERSIEFHRSSRLELFGKIERLLTALGRDGRQCVLYRLCDAAQRTVQGSFMQEFFRAVFTLPKGTEFEEYYKEYDRAHTQATDCLTKYPGCLASTQL